MAHNFDVHTRTIVTVHITVPDDVLAQMGDETNEMEVVLVSRVGSTLPKKLSYRDIRGLLEGDPRHKPIR